MGRIIEKFKLTGSVESSFKRPLANWKVLKHECSGWIAGILTRTECKATTVTKIKKRYRLFKPRFINTFKERDIDSRFDFAAWIQGEFEENNYLTECIEFTDKATFSWNIVVSFQNCRCWSDENPNFVIECNNPNFEQE